MNAKLWICVIAGVLVAHLAALFVVDHLKNFGRPLPKPVEPNFTSSTTTYIAPDGTKVGVMQEFTVTTEMASEETLSKLPRPPAAPQADGGVR